MIILCLFLVINVTSGSNILCVFQLPFKSHQNTFIPVCKELSLRGHNVTILTTNPLNDPALTNLTEIDLSFAYEHMNKGDMQTDVTNKIGVKNEIQNVYDLLEQITIAELSHPRMQTFLHDKSLHFDVAIIQYFHPTMHALSAKFRCPFIGIASIEAFITGYDVIGNPSHPILNPDKKIPYKNIEWFWSRLSYTLWSIWIRLYYKYTIVPRQDRIARHFFGNDIPYLEDIEKNISLLLVNVNPILNSIRPNVPAVIELGTLYVKDTTAIPKDLQKELDDATEGAIYFSMGSNLKSTHLPSQLFQQIAQALSELPYKVFWKWESDHFLNKPKNVVLRKWYPQKSILGHKNIKAFVMQGGLQSIEEAIFNAVPLIIIPFRIDQFTNAEKMTKLGIAKTIEWESLSKEKLKQAILEVTKNKQYKQTTKKIAQLILDVPMTGMEKAIWWTEYVIRHKGARHLRSPVIDFPLYQYLLLDVVLFVLVALLVIIFITYRTVLFISSLLSKIVHQKLKTQ